MRLNKVFACLTKCWNMTHYLSESDHLLKQILSSDMQMVGSEFGVNRIESMLLLSTVQPGGKDDVAGYISWPVGLLIQSESHSHPTQHQITLLYACHNYKHHGILCFKLKMGLLYNSVGTDSMLDYPCVSLFFWQILFGS